ncbi:MAG: cation transporter, partial [Myxococcota bacterium]
MTEMLVDSTPEDPAALQRRTVWRWALLSLVFALGMTAAKWIAFALTLSAAVLSDAMESFVNILSSSFVLYAIWLSNRPRDDEHPYGHGKVEYFSAGFEGALVLFAAISVALVGIQR